MRNFNCIVRKNSCYIVVADFNTGSGLKIFEYNKVDNCFYWVENVKSTGNKFAVPNLFDISEEEEFQYSLVHDDSLGFTFNEMKIVQRQMILYSNLPKHFIKDVHRIVI